MKCKACEQVEVGADGLCETCITSWLWRRASKGNVPAYPSIYQEGHLSVEQKLNIGMIKGNVGIQIASDGRIWICLDGCALLRFTPKMREV